MVVKELVKGELFTNLTKVNNNVYSDDTIKKISRKNTCM